MEEFERIALVVQQKQVAAEAPAKSMAGLARGCLQVERFGNVAAREWKLPQQAVQVPLDMLSHRLLQTHWLSSVPIGHVSTVLLCPGHSADTAKNSSALKANIVFFFRKPPY